MDIFNISEYITIVKKGLTEESAQGPAGILLLSQIGNMLHPPVDFSDTKITRLVKHNNEVQSDIINAVANEINQNNLVIQFKMNVEPDFNSVTIDNVCLNLINKINEDHKLSEKNKKILNDYYESGDHATFLAHALIHAVGRANTLGDIVNTTDDLPYLSEANNHCPNCNTELIKVSKSKNIPFYQVSKIYNESFDEDIKKDLETVYAAPKSYSSFDNKIALCLNCANEYRLDPTIETYKFLYEKKLDFKTNLEISKKLNNIDVEKELQTIIKKLDLLTKNDDSSLSDLDPKELKDKIPDDYLLKDDITRWVLKYYNFIEKMFSDLDSTGQSKYGIISTQINLAFKNLDALGTLTQKQIFYKLSEWISDKIGYSKEQILVVNILVAFFVQNCEVFYEVSK